MYLGHCKQKVPKLNPKIYGTKRLKVQRNIPNQIVRYAEDNVFNFKKMSKPGKRVQIITISLPTKREDQQQKAKQISIPILNHQPF
jgi:hypothetical protein